MHQMDLCPDLSMLHVLFYTVRSLKKRSAVVWTDCLCFVFFHTTNKSCIWLNETGLPDKPQAESLIYIRGVFQHARLSCRAKTRS